MDEAKYSVHLGADKMYYDLRDMYWWLGMKKDIVVYVTWCLTCLKVKVEHQRPSGLLQQLEISKWKWEGISMDFVTKLPKTSSGHHNLGHCVMIEIFARHDVTISIISDRERRFTSRVVSNFTVIIIKKLYPAMLSHVQFLLTKDMLETLMIGETVGLVPTVRLLKGEKPREPVTLILELLQE
nr:putative reverse transcriptase domain-containing protein [Tanacetum cinerariifolium]